MALKHFNSKQKKEKKKQKTTEEKRNVNDKNATIFEVVHVVTFKLRISCLLLLHHVIVIIVVAVTDIFHISTPI